MIRAPLRNRTFTWMGERYAPLINPHHFLGRTPFDIPWHLNEPPVNLKLDGKLFELSLAVPGYTKDEITITVSDEVLTVRGKKQRQAESTDPKYVLKEYDMDSFERKFQLAENIGKEKIEASLANGILTLVFIDVPASEESPSKTVRVS